ncbi:FG-GAP-like repeat-containing protein [Thiothrix winogradskyi]|uniref:Insecticide toxin TcdB middle/N-terminal domain-containing protein n=1 Tax=Thiothrix winogradskyi TaxID=96472 RepID=A0ABY3SY75_9GAMM|nr:FG-GAP-like repeat-containing protein [Thiothrix winogradskyi]UJS23589.1 hypothetical protein L2Y54_16840 [Thiothrix winogradskyi]
MKRQFFISDVVHLCIVFLLIVSCDSIYAGQLVNSLEGNASTNQGQLNWSLPIDVPVGSNGISPKISLEYTPAGSNGIMGVGFQLGGLSTISRCPSSKEYDGVDGGVTFTNKDRYCLDGQRLLLVSDGSYRTATESFSKIIFTGTYWLIYTKDGFIQEYGNTTDARITSATNSNAILAWRINQKRDRFKGIVNYEYNQLAGTGVSVLSKIRWSIHELQLIYEGRNDTSSSYQFGDIKTLSQRVSKINVSTKENLLHQYQLNYEANADGFSRVSRISLCDGSGNCSPDTTFEWQATGNPRIVNEIDIGNDTGFASFTMADLNQDGRSDVCYLKNGLFCDVAGARWSVSLGSFSNHPDSAETLVLIDLNNDTYPDYCIQSETNIQCGLNNGSGFSASTTWSSQFNRSQMVRIIDLNNDKLPDICEINESGMYCAYNGSFGFLNKFKASSGEWGWNIKPAQNIGNTTIGFVDINGDGLTDLCGAGIKRVVGGSTMVINGFYCSLHTGYNSSQQPIYSEMVSYALLLGNLVADKTFQDTFRYSDLNADGLPDTCWREGNEYKCSINTGRAFEPPRKWADAGINGGWIDNAAGRRSLMLHDINNDGRSDLCVEMSGYSFGCGINWGGGFSNLQPYAPLRYGSGTIDLPNAKTNKGHLPVRLADINADGNADFCYRGIQGGITCGLAAPQEPALLRRVTTGYGNITEIEYGFLSNPAVYAKDGQSRLGLIDVQPNQRVVKAIASSNGVGGLKKISYFYRGLRYDQKEGIRSFSVIDQLDESDGKIIRSSYHQDKDRNGLAYQVNLIVKDIVVQSTYTEWQVFSGIATNSKFRMPKKVIEINRDYKNGLKTTSKITTYDQYDTYGNARLITIVNDAETILGIDKNIKITATIYKNDVTNWLLGKPETVTVTHENPAVLPVITRKTSFTYYPSGALWTETIEPNNTYYSLKSTFEYDAFGNRTKVTLNGWDGKAQVSRTASSKYDDQSGLFLVSKTNALNHIETFTPHTRCSGLPAIHIDANKLKTILEYDSLCRKIKETRSDNTQTIWNYAWKSNYPANYGMDDHSVYMITETSSGSSPTTVWYDGLGREVHTQTLGFNGEKIFQDNVYDARGLLVSTTPPYEEGKFAGDNSYQVTSQYDDIGRIIELKRPSEDGNSNITRYDYNGLTTTVTDANGRSRSTTTNALNKPARIAEANDASTISHFYDGIGNLRKTDTNGQVIEITYDILGNKSAMKDPAMGYWEYKSNAFGELYWQKDAKSQISIMEYDILGRMVKRSAIDDTASWTYDTALYGKGKLAKEANKSSQTVYTYDMLGRASKTSRTIDGETFTSSLFYDQYSRPMMESYPDNVFIMREYSDTGYLKRISIPKENIWDYSAGQVLVTVQKLAVEVGKLNQQIKAQTSTYLLYIGKATTYQQNADLLDKESGQFSDEAKILRQAAEQLLILAADHKRQMDFLNATATKESTKILKFLKELNGAYQYGENST